MGLEIPDYHEVIDHPMDLGTIMNKINNYSQFKEFVADLFLVFDNCTRYNPKQNMIHQTALKLRDYATKQLGRICQSDYEQWKDDDEASPVPYNESTLAMDGQTVPSKVETVIKPMVLSQNEFEEDDNVLDEEDEDNDIAMESVENDESMPDIFNQCDEIEDEDERNKIMISHLMEKQELNPDTVHNLDLVQKEELQRGIQCLDSDHFDPLVNMLQSFIPEGENEDDEVELDVDSIDDPLQVKMYNYMLQAIHQQEMERIHREGGNAPIAENDDEQEKIKEKEVEIQQENEQLDDDNDNDDQMEDVQVESMQPNVVNAFPIAEGAENEEQGRKEDENVGGGDEEQQYLFGNDEEMEVKVNDDENNEDVEMEAVNEADDIVADIANVVATETDKNEDVDVNVDDAMPIAMNEEENMQMNEEKENKEENVVADDDVNKEQTDLNVAETETVIPTMPALQTENELFVEENVDNNTNNDDGVMEEGVKNLNVQMDNVSKDEEIVVSNGVEKEMNEAENVNEIANEEVVNDQIEDEDVDTPLADDIEF